MNKFICIHGHFYQPPRENPWLEAIELQDSAFPYHDWNERIAAESYAPNAAARILDGEGRITEIVNNYSKISFNFGPTLMAWLQDKEPEIHDAIVAADHKSRNRFAGHGSALAQAYNHMILPLANAADKQTQIGWGIRDFEKRFDRFPEGMWLAETAVDTATLEALAAQNITFTILSPFQAAKVRKIGGRGWRDVNGGRIDPTMPYLVNLPSGKRIRVFFYDAPVSQAVAFEQLLTSGERFADRLMSAFSDRRSWDQMVHIATDGESYGHHHAKGEMALAYALHHIESNELARLTNYGAFLSSHPPTHEVQIHEKSAWSCSHGVERWRSDCGCNSGGRPGWNQAWRTPLREALDWLRDRLAPRYEQFARNLLADPWAARNDYIDVILDRSADSRRAFFDRHALRPLSPDEQVAAVKCLEIQRHAMLMFTSCGWFFDELSGIETVQILQYAGRAIQQARSLFDEDFEPGFLDILCRAQSNIPEHENGRTIYRKFVKPAVVDWENVAAHYAITSLFSDPDYQRSAKIYSFHFNTEDHETLTAGNARIAVGRSTVSFEITGETASLSYSVLHLGDHNLNGGVRHFTHPDSYAAMKAEVFDAFRGADFPLVIRLMDRHFGESSYSLKTLFRDEQRRIVHQILESAMEDIAGQYRLISDNYTPMMRFLGDLNVPLPSALQTAADFVLNLDLRREFESPKTNLDIVKTLLIEGRERRVSLTEGGLAYVIEQNLERHMNHFVAEPDHLPSLTYLEQLTAILRMLPFDINLWKIQNRYFELMQATLPPMQIRADRGSETAAAWVEHYRDFGRNLGFRV